MWKRWSVEYDGLWLKYPPQEGNIPLVGGERGPLVESAVVQARIILYRPACLSVQLPQISNYIRYGADTSCSCGKFTPRDQFWAAASLLALKSSMLRHFTIVPLSVWYITHRHTRHCAHSKVHCTRWTTVPLSAWYMHSRRSKVLAHEALQNALL